MFSHLMPRVFANMPHRCRYVCLQRLRAAHSICTQFNLHITHTLRRTRRSTACSPLFLPHSLAYFHNRMVYASENEELSTRATKTTHFTAANTSTASTPAQVGDDDDDDGADAVVACGTSAGAQTLYAHHKQPVAAAGDKQRLLLSPRPQTPLPTKPVPPVAATPTTITTTTTTRVMSAISSGGSNSSAVITVHQHLNRSSAVSAATAMPLFEVKLELLPPEAETQSETTAASDVWHTNTEIRFVPSFNVSVENNFQQIVEQLLEDIHQTSHGCMPRRIVDDKSLSDDNEDNDGSAEDEGAHNGNNNNHLNDDDGAVVDTVECNNNDYVLQAENLRSFAILQHRRRTEEDRNQRQTRNASLSTLHAVAVAKRLQLQEIATKAVRSQKVNGDQTGEKNISFMVPYIRNRN